MFARLLINGWMDGWMMTRLPAPYFRPGTERGVCCPVIPTCDDILWSVYRIRPCYPGNTHALTGWTTRTRYDQVYRTLGHQIPVASSAVSGKTLSTHPMPMQMDFLRLLTKTQTLIGVTAEVEFGLSVGWGDPILARSRVHTDQAQGIMFALLQPTFL